MIPKFTILAMLRSSFVNVAGSLPSTSAAVVVWMSSPRANDSRSFGSPELVPGLRDEGRTDLAPELGANRDRLQVRVRRRQPTRRRDGLVEVRVQTPVLRQQRRQRLQIRVEELRVLAPLLDHLDDRVVLANRAEHLRVRRVAGLALAPRCQLELLEQDARDLLRRAEHELLAREVVRLRLEL